MAAVAVAAALARWVAGATVASVSVSVAYGALMLVSMAGLSLYSSRQATVRSEELTRVGRAGIWALLLLAAGASVSGTSIDLRAGLAALAWSSTLSPGSRIPGTTRVMRGA